MQDTATPHAALYSHRAVALWLFIVAGCVAGLVLLGGLTRLMGAGLSITEWQPVIGIIPPLSLADWEIAFQKYQTIAEYRLVNSDMSLAEFKIIYWWEWAHRLMGRAIGLIFLVPFLWFLWRKHIPARFIAPLCVLFALGGLQGFIGWYMVQSGLEADRINVSQYRLAVHLGLALIIFGMSLWLALRLWHKDKKQGDKLPAHQFYFAFVLLGLIFLQCLAGALVAGLEAGKTYTDWPFMDGQFIPSGLLAMSPLIVNFFENILTVQWQHRIIAYLLFGLAIWHYWQQTRSTSARSAPAESNVASNSAAWLALAICGQAILGIATVMGAVPLILAVLHQFGALLVLTIAIYHLYRLRIACNIE